MMCLVFIWRSQRCFNIFTECRCSWLFSRFVDRVFRVPPSNVNVPPISTPPLVPVCTRMDEQAPDTPEELKIDFSNGIPVKVKAFKGSASRPDVQE